MTRRTGTHPGLRVDVRHCLHLLPTNPPSNPLDVLDRHIKQILPPMAKFVYFFCVLCLDCAAVEVHCNARLANPTTPWFLVYAHTVSTLVGSTTPAQLTWFCS